MPSVRKIPALLAMAAFLAALATPAPGLACAADCGPQGDHPCDRPAATAHPCDGEAAAPPPCHAPEAPADFLKGACCADAAAPVAQETLVARPAPPDAPAFQIVPLAVTTANPGASRLQAPRRTASPPGSPGNALYLSLGTLLI